MVSIGTGGSTSFLSLQVCEDPTRRRFVLRRLVGATSDSESSDSTYFSSKYGRGHQVHKQDKLTILRCSRGRV